MLQFNQYVTHTKNGSSRVGLTVGCTSFTLTEYLDYPNVYYFVDNCICSIFIRRCDLVRQSCPSFTVGGRGDNQWDSHHTQSPEPKL